MLNVPSDVGLFFSADEHYGHANIIKYCNRPFKDVAEMNDGLIERHNARVNKGDVVIHCGDFAFHQNPIPYIKRLKGTHYFIRGNHDPYKGAEVKHDHIMDIRFREQHIVACHFSMQAWHEQHHGAWHVFGHSHGKLTGIGDSLDVGVDAHDLYPVSFDKVSQIIKHKTNVFDNWDGVLGF